MIVSIILIFVKYSLIEAIAMGGYDAKKGHGYDTIDGKMNPRPQQDGWPYDPYELDDPAEWGEHGAFDNSKTLDKFTSKTNNAPAKVDTTKVRDRSSYVDGATRGLSDNLVRSYIKIYLKELGPISLRSRSSATSGATTDWGERIKRGGKPGWSTAPALNSKESQEPVYSLKDLMTKREDNLDRYDGEVSDIENLEAIYSEDFE